VAPTLYERLRGVIQVPAQNGAAAKAPVSAPAHRDDGEAAAILGGEWQRAGAERSLLVRRRVAADEIYGSQRVGEIGRTLTNCASAAHCFGAPGAMAPFLFFDLETTGLSGGAGTYAFLVGVGRFDSDAGFVIEQHLLTDLRGERAMLNLVADRLGDAGALVTYNGKSFDAPLVESRYLFHRDESPCAGLPHLDVLHPARRFWGRANHAGCALATLESRLLHVRRIGDVPGMEIPARYFHFVRSGDARGLAGVLEHNRMDLLTLAGLTARLLWLSASEAAVITDPHEAIALCHVFQRADLMWRAEQAGARAIELCGSDGRFSAIKVEAFRALALLARRSRRYEVAVARWRELLDVTGCPRSIAREANEALAIHHEHRVRDLEVARSFALQELKNGEPARDDAARHRLARIERKLISERRPLFPSWPSPPSCGSPPSASRTSS
jgi:uncharacterized protein YprB with RNaseH-like and TPR domain